LVDNGNPFFFRFLEEKEVVIYPSIWNGNQKLFDVLERIVEEAGGIVSTVIGNLT